MKKIGELDTLDFIIGILCVIPIFMLISARFHHVTIDDEELNPKISNRFDIYSSWTDVVPKIDGKLKENEWDDATKVYAFLRMKNIVGNLVGGHPTVVYVKNDAIYLYLGIRVKGDKPEGKMIGKYLNSLRTDLFKIRFDNDMDGILETGEDEKNAAILLKQTWYDDIHHVSPEDRKKGVTERDKTSNGRASIRFARPKKNTDGDYFCEFAIPLDSKDDEDIIMVPGQKVRFNIFFISDYTTSQDELSIGGLSGNDLEDASDWGYLTLAKSNNTKPIPPYNWLGENGN